MVSVFWNATCSFPCFTKIGGWKCLGRRISTFHYHQWTKGRRVAKKTNDLWGDYMNNFSLTYDLIDWNQQVGRVGGQWGNQEKSNAVLLDHIGFSLFMIPEDTSFIDQDCMCSLKVKDCMILHCCKNWQVKWTSQKEPTMSSHSWIEKTRRRRCWVSYWWHHPLMSLPKSLATRLFWLTMRWRQTHWARNIWYQSRDVKAETVTTRILPTTATTKTTTTTSP